MLVLEAVLATALVAGVCLGLAMMTERPAEVFGFTFAVHIMAITVLDILQVTNPWSHHEVAPHVELVDIEVPPVLKPPPPVIKARVEPVKDNTKQEQRPRTIREPQRVQQPQPQQVDIKPDPSADPGGAPTVAMPDIAPSATGVAVAVGRRTGPIGRGGTGTGTGSGAGSGTDTAPVVVPVSVATIKSRALPKGDYGYFDAGKDYPAEARQLGIEGVIRVRLVVDAAGKVTSAVLLNKLGHGLDELALDRSRKIEFEPAKDTDDKPVSSVVVWTFNMTLPK